MVTVQNSSYRRDLIRKQTEIQLRIAGLDHATQNPRCVDTPCGSINRVAVAAYPLYVAGSALVFRNKSFTLLQVCAFEKRRQFLSMQRHQKHGNQTKDQMFHATECIELPLNCKRKDCLEFHAELKTNRILRHADGLSTRQERLTGH